MLNICSKVVGVLGHPEEAGVITKLNELVDGPGAAALERVLKEMSGASSTRLDRLERELNGLNPLPKKVRVLCCFPSRTATALLVLMA